MLCPHTQPLLSWCLCGALSSPGLLFPSLFCLLKSYPQDMLRCHLFSETLPCSKMSELSPLASGLLFLCPSALVQISPSLFASYIHAELPRRLWACWQWRPCPFIPQLYTFQSGITAGNSPLSQYVSALCTSSATWEDIIISSLHMKNLSPGDTK